MTVQRRCKWMLITAAAEHTGHTVKAIRRKIERGDLPVGIVVEKRMGRWYMNLDEFDRFIEGAY
ncbi:hypothetical protein EQ875_01612 [Photobacterium damselae subsp. damselae]|nr:hypothetical protein EQ875_01612 [Photobacterium damselae subsp. damselae]